MGEPFVHVRDLAKSFRTNGRAYPVLEKVSFGLEQGEVLGVIGCSGCGKSTLLNILAGFIPADAGEVRIAGRVVQGPGPDRGVVFQEGALFPWLTVAENIDLGLRRTVRDRAERSRRIGRILEMVGLTGYADHLPRDISGGMRQRVALGRVLVLDPVVLLMDEPFASLDAQTRSAMHDLLLSLQSGLGQTLVFVTHDVEEAVKLSDTILVMGRAAHTVTAAVPVDFPRPRDVDDPSFIALRRGLTGLL